MATGAILTCISLAFGLVKFCSWLWSVTGSEGAQLRRLQAYLAAQRTRLEAERAKLAVTNATIDAAPDKTGQDLVDDLNRHFGGKP